MQSSCGSAIVMQAVRNRVSRNAVILSGGLCMSICPLERICCKFI